MKRLPAPPSTVRRELGPITLYSDDVRDLVEMLDGESRGRVKVASQGLELESLDELARLDDPAKTLTLTTTGPLTTVELRPDAAHLQGWPLDADEQLVVQRLADAVHERLALRRRTAPVWTDLQAPLILVTVQAAFVSVLALFRILPTSAIWGTAAGGLLVITGMALYLRRHPRLLRSSAIVHPYSSVQRQPGSLRPDATALSAAGSIASLVGLVLTVVR